MSLDGMLLEPSLVSIFPPDFHWSTNLTTAVKVFFSGSGPQYLGHPERTEKPKHFDGASSS